MISGVKGIISYEGKILLILRDNKPDIPYPNTWEFTGGGKEGDETLEEAGIREMYEELGIKPKDYTFLGAENYSGRQAGRFISILDEQEYKMIRLGNEGQKYDFFTIEECLTMNMVPNLKKFLTNNKRLLIDSIERGVIIDVTKIVLVNEN
jgi:8-oxo-dGTP diphosphatase